MSNGHSHAETKTESNLDTWSRRSLRVLRSIANATFTDEDSDESDGGAEDAAWKMESFVGPRIGSVGRSSLRVEIQNLNMERQLQTSCILFLLCSDLFREYEMPQVVSNAGLVLQSKICV